MHRRQTTECGQAAATGEEQLTIPQSISIGDVQLSSSKAQRRAVPGSTAECLWTLQQQHDGCVQQPSHSPVRGKSIRHNEDPIDSAHTLCSLHLASSQLTDKPIPPATNLQQIQAALTHTDTLAGPSHADRAAWWWGQYSPAPFPAPEVILQGKYKHVKGFISQCCFYSCLRLA